jgi:hypothetical protein
MAWYASHGMIAYDVIFARGKARARGGGAQKITVFDSLGHTLLSKHGYTVVNGHNDAACGTHCRSPPCGGGSGVLPAWCKSSVIFARRRVSFVREEQRRELVVCVIETGSVIEFYWYNFYVGHSFAFSTVTTLELTPFWISGLALRFLCDGLAWQAMPQNDAVHPESSVLETARVFV